MHLSRGGTQLPPPHPAAVYSGIAPIHTCCTHCCYTGGLAAIVPSKWTFFLPNWLLETVCRCKSLTETEGAIALTSRPGRPERSMSLSSEIKGGRSPRRGSSQRGSSARSGSGNEMRYVRGNSGSADADAGASRGSADGTRDTLNPLHPDAQRALASEGSPSSGGAEKRPNGAADKAAVNV